MLTETLLFPTISYNYVLPFILYWLFQSIQKLWDDLYQFNCALSRSTAQNEDAIVKIEDMGRNWVAVFAAVYSLDKIMPYMHAMKCNVG